MKLSTQKAVCWKVLLSVPHSNENLRRLRDQALLVIWALQELAGAEMHRLNVGDLVERDGQSWLIVANNKGSRTVLLKAAIAHIVQRYLEARKAVGESLTQESPLFIGIGNRSGGDRLTPWSIGFVVKHYHRNLPFEGQVYNPLRISISGLAYIFVPLLLTGPLLLGGVSVPEESSEQLS